MLASPEQPLLACLAPVFPVVRRLVVGADILSYLAISASWPPLTQNDVGGKDSIPSGVEAGFPVTFVFMEEQHLLFHVTTYLVCHENFHLYPQGLNHELLQLLAFNTP